MEFKEQMQAYRERFENALPKLLLPPETDPPRIHQAMRYSMEAGGKRLRPMLLYAVGDLFAAELPLDPAAIAIECIHTYSLVHDDLPAMDNSDLRRGKPTCHRAFDEATAVLAGDALLTYAFELLATHYRDWPEIGLVLVADLARAAGSRHLIGGQMADILSERSGSLDAHQLEFIQANKTAALIACSLIFGARLARVDQNTTDMISRLGHHIGIAFQLIDDLLDATRDSETLGKPAGIDAVNDTGNAIHLFGIEGTRERAAQQTGMAHEICSQLGRDASFLSNLIGWMETRIS